jgi:hypothetical protein
VFNLAAIASADLLLFWVLWVLRIATPLRKFPDVVIGIPHGADKLLGKSQFQLAAALFAVADETKGMY